MNAHGVPREVLTLLRQPRGIESAHEICVFCLSGTAWLTIEGQAQDVILVAGERHCVRARRKVFLAGMPVCRVAIEPGDAAAGMHD